MFSLHQFLLAHRLEYFSDNRECGMLWKICQIENIDVLGRSTSICMVQIFYHVDLFYNFHMFVVCNENQYTSLDATLLSSELSVAISSQA